MSVSLRTGFHSSLGETLYNDVTSGRTNLYYFVGGTIPWNVSDLPPDYLNTLDEEMSVRNEIISVKKVTPSDVSYGLTRYDWQSGTIYDMYRSDVDLSTKVFYVLTDEFNVYKCIDNNKGAFSTQKPSGMSYNIVTYSDGYQWKYMYSIPKSLRNKFLFNDVMPVFTSLQNPFYDDGNIKEINVISQGSGYQNDPVTSISISGGSPTTQAVLLPVIGSNGQILKVYIKDGGSDYSGVPMLSVIGIGTGKYPGNDGAVLTAVMLNGKIDAVLIEDPGQGYSSDIRTTITIEGDGSGASLVPLIDSGKIIDVIIEDEGSGYTYADLFVFSAIDPLLGYAPGSGASLQVNLSKGNLDSIQSIIEQTSIPGGIHSIVVTNPGVNYFETPTIIIDGDGTGCVATPILSGYGLVGVTITNPGTGYSYANVTVVPAINGTGATAKAMISPKGGHGRNAVKELLCDKVILTSSIQNEPILGVSIQNDYRQYGLVKSPQYFTDSRRFNKQIGSGCYKVKLNSAVSYPKDAFVYVNSTKKFQVIYSSDTTLLLKPQNNKTISVGDKIRLEGALQEYSISEVTNPDINRYTGELLYVNNQMAIEYSALQTLTLRTVLKL